VVDIVTRLRNERSGGSNPSKGKEFLFSKHFEAHPASYATTARSFSLQ